MQFSLRRTSISQPSICAASVALLISAFGVQSHALPVERVDNTTTLDLGGAWLGGNIPGVGDVGVWNSAVTATGAGVGIGAGLSVAGIQIVDPGAAITIAGGSGPLTLGASGIDMSTATQNLTLSAPVTLGTAQPWSIATGRTLTVSAALTAAAGNALTINGPGAVTFTTVAASTVGGLSIVGATVNLNTASFTNPLGTVANAGVVTFDGGTITNIAASGNTTNFSNPVAVASSKIGTINMGPARFTWGASGAGNQPAVTGAGILNLNYSNTATRTDLYTNFSAFTGTVNITATGGAGLRYFVSSGASGSNAATFVFAGTGNFQPQTNSTGNTLNFGSLTSASTYTLGGSSNAGGGSPTYSVGAANVNSVIAGAISGNAILTKVGTATLTLSGINTNTGITNVNGGILDISGASTAKLGTGNVSVLATAVSLNIGTGVLNAINDTSTLSLAGGGVAGIADNGFITLAAGVNETIGGLSLAGATQVPGSYGATGSGATFVNDEFFSGSGVLTVVPEPSAVLSLLGGIGSLLALRRRSICRRSPAR